MEEKMKRAWKKTAAVALAGVMSVGMLSGCGEAKLDGTKTVATVNDSKIPMGILSLAVRTQQSSMEAMYSYYIQLGYMSSLWDQAMDSAGEQTYGQQMVSSVLEELEEWNLLKEHAADYSVELSADEQKAIADAAAKFMADNTEEAIAELAVTEDQVKEYLELTTYHKKVEDAIKAEADTEVSDEEAQQSGFTYVKVPLDAEEETEDAAETDEAETNAETAEEAADVDNTEAEEAEAEETDTAEAADAAETAATEAADAAETAATEAADAAETAATEAADAAETAATEAADAAETAATETEAADTEETDTAEAEAADTKDAKTKAEELLAAMQADPTADMNTAAQAIDETLYSSTGSFDANPAEEEESEEDTSYSAYPDELIEALRGLKDGEVLSEVLETEEGYYVARLDKVFDEEKTENKKSEIVSKRQSDHYTEVVDGWKEAAKITTDEKVLAKLVLTDNHTFTEKSVKEAAEAAEEESAAEDETAAEEEASDETETTAEDETAAEEEASDETETTAEEETAAETEAASGNKDF